MENIFNFRKKMAQNMISEKSLEEQRENIESCTEDQKVVEKNMNLSIPIKNKDNTIPFNVQMESARTGEEEAILESKSSSKEVSFGEQKDKKTEIGQKMKDMDNQNQEEYKKAENEQKADTEFWDKYVGVQLEGPKTTVIKNIPDRASQLPSKKKDAEEIKNFMKDADAMIFHIYATANSNNRELTHNEKQQIIDINASKTRFMNDIEEIEPIRRSLEGSQDIKKKQIKQSQIGITGEETSRYTGTIKVDVSVTSSDDQTEYNIASDSINKALMKAEEIAPSFVSDPNLGISFVLQGLDKTR